jgi:hypothetical protein
MHEFKLLLVNLRWWVGALFNSEMDVHLKFLKQACRLNKKGQSPS